MTNELIYNFIGYIDIYCLLLHRYLLVENENGSEDHIINNRHRVYFYILSSEKKNLLKLDQALNDAGGGQFRRTFTSTSIRQDRR